MNHIIFSKKNLVPYTYAFLKPGIRFSPSYKSSTFVNYIKFSRSDNPTKKNYRVTVNSIVEEDNKCFVKIESKNYHEEDNTYSDLQGNYELTLDTITKVSPDDAENIYPQIEFKNLDLTIGDEWIFCDIEDYDLTDYLVSCSSINFQGSGNIDQYTYLGNSLSLEVLKSRNKDRLFEPGYEKNIFKLWNYEYLGYLSVFEIQTGFKEEDKEVLTSSFSGYLEEISERSNTVSITLGDGIYLTKELYAHNVGIVIKRRDLRQLGRTSQLLKENDMDEVGEIFNNIYNPPNEINFETFYKPIVKDYNNQKLEIEYKTENNKIKDYKIVEIKDYINRVGDLESTNALLDHDNGIIEFEEAPLDSEYDDIYFTFKHAHMWKHPSFLAQELFKSIGYDTNDEDFNQEPILSNKGLVFNNQGRVLTSSEDRSSEINYSIGYREGLFYFAVGNRIVIKDENQGSETILNDIYTDVGTAIGEWCVYKILVKDNDLVFFISKQHLIKRDNQAVLYPDQRYGSKVKVYRLKLDNDGYPLVTNGSISLIKIFETPSDSSQTMSLDFGNNYKSKITIEYGYTLMGTPENKDYSNKAFIYNSHVYFIFQVKMLMVDANPNSEGKIKAIVETVKNRKLASKDKYENIYYPKVKNFLVRIHVDGEFSTTTSNELSTNSDSNYLSIPNIDTINSNDIVIVTDSDTSGFNGVWEHTGGNYFSQADGYFENFNWGGDDMWRLINPENDVPFFPKLKTLTLSDGTGVITNLSTYNAVELKTHDSPFTWHKDMEKSLEKWAKDFKSLEEEENTNEDVKLDDSFSMWGRLPQARCDFFVTEDGEVYSVQTEGDGGAHFLKTPMNRIGVGGNNESALGDGSDEGKIKIYKHNIDLSGLPELQREVDFNDIGPHFFDETSSTHINPKYNQEFYQYCNELVPFDIWGLCVLKDDDNYTFSFCSHWRMRIFRSETRFRDFKAIVFNVNNKWVHQQDGGGLQTYINNKLIASKIFRTQRFLTQGTRSFETFGMRLDYPYALTEYKKEKDGGEWHNIYSVNNDQIEDAKNLLTWDTMRYELRGQGELSMIAKNPIVWTNEDGNKVIVYQGGHFGKYVTTGLLAKKESNTDNFKWREARLSVRNVKNWEKNFNDKRFDIKSVPIKHCYPSENSHGRLIQFKPMYNVSPSVEWDYLGYPYGESQTDIFKEFSTETVVDKYGGLNFVSARSCRVDVNLSTSGWTREEDWKGVKYLCGGHYAANIELDSSVLENLDNFMWISYSRFLTPKVPVANFNDKYIFNVLNSLALIMDYEFGIENQKPFFRKKSNIKFLTNDLLIDSNNISDIDPSLQKNQYYFIPTNEETDTQKGEIIYIDNDGLLIRGSEKTVVKIHDSGNPYYLLSAILEPSNIIAAPNYNVNSDFIYNKIRSSFSYYSHSLRENVTYKIDKQVNYQNQFKRNFELNIDYIRSREIASTIVDRFIDYLSVENTVLDLSIQYMPFLKNGDVVLIRELDAFNIKDQLFKIRSASHDLKEFKTSIKAISIKNAMLRWVD